MKAHLKILFALAVLDLLPAALTADVVVTNTYAGYVEHVTMHNIITCPGVGVVSEFDCEHYLNYNETVAYYDGPEGGNCYHSYNPGGTGLIPVASVSISGASSLFHYQGPYPQPNDRTSLPGYSFPAPTITLTASPTGGSASGYVWSIVQGSDKVQFSGPTTNSTVQVSGIAKSSQANDVTIHVTATVNSQSVGATYSLTVREPTSITLISTSQGGPPPGALFGYTSDITYEVRDQFNQAVGENISVDETVTQCANPNNVPPGLLHPNDDVTRSNGQITDRVSIGFNSAFVQGFCITFDQTVAVGGSGTVRENLVRFGADEVVVSLGHCTANDGSCN